MIKLQDFAKRQGVTDRAIQKHLKTYAAELEGLYQRKGPNGTWLSEEACEILRSKMKQAPLTILEASDREEELNEKIRDLERELFDTQKAFTSYVQNATPLLQKASEQLALAERAQEHKERADALDVQNRSLIDEKEKIEAKAKEDAEASQKRIGELTEALEEKDKDLQAEKTRKISFKEFLQRRKK